MDTLKMEKVLITKNNEKKGGIEDQDDIDKALLVKLKGGDEEAFMQIFCRWERPLLNFLTKLIGSATDAEDVSQETFATLWGKRESIDPAKNIKTYIFLIAKQITWKHLRKDKYKNDFISNTFHSEDTGLSADDIIIAKELELLVEYSLNRMPARMREVYKLYYNEHLSYEQIADRLDTTTGNVRKQIFQARQSLKEIIKMAVLLFFI